MEGNKKFVFKGTGSGLLGIYLTNIIFTLLTLGIYSFWARVKTKNFFYSNTEYQGDNFKYTATGGERFKGFLKGVFIILCAFLLLGVLRFVVVKILGILGLSATDAKTIADGVVAVAYLIAFIGVVPLITIGKRRYLLNRTTFKNIRFRFTGKVFELIKIYLIGIPLAVISFGLATPWLIYQHNKYNIVNSYYGNEPFEFEGKLGEFFKIVLLGSFLTVITFGIYGFWMKAKIYNYKVNNTKFQGKSFSSTMSGTEYFVTNLFAMLIIVCTLGIGFPWAAIMRYEIYLKYLNYEGQPNFAEIQARADKGASALSDGVGEAFDALESIADMVT